jgi:hypothetical protein
MTNESRIQWENLKRIVQFGDLGVDGRKISKWILQK